MHQRSGKHRRHTDLFHNMAGEIGLELGARPTGQVMLRSKPG
jgi:hypothetical protein